MGAGLSVNERQDNKVDNSIRNEMIDRSRQSCKSASCSNTIEVGDIVIGKNAKIDFSQECDLTILCQLDYVFDEVNKTLLEAETDQTNRVSQPGFLTATANVGGKKTNFIDNSIIHKRLYDTIQECESSLARNKLTAKDVKLEEGAEFKLSQVGKSMYTCLLDKTLDVHTELTNKTKNKQSNETNALAWEGIVVLILIIIAICVIAGIIGYIYQKNKGGNNDDYDDEYDDGFEEDEYGDNNNNNDNDADGNNKFDQLVKWKKRRSSKNKTRGPNKESVLESLVTFVQDKARKYQSNQKAKRENKSKDNAKRRLGTLISDNQGDEEEERDRELMERFQEKEKENDEENDDTEEENGTEEENEDEADDEERKNEQDNLGFFMTTPYYFANHLDD